MMLFAARLTSVASARSSPRTYRHTGTGSLRPLQYLDGCAGPFSAAHGFRIFFFLTFATGPFRAVTAKPRCIGTAVPGVPGLAWSTGTSSRVFGVLSAQQQRPRHGGVYCGAFSIFHLPIYLDPFRFIFGLALSTVNSTESSRASLGIA
ncbi:hypothetical protein J3E69DRAFT_28421 [Trichoderma sp. SZMC 28015]